MKTANHYTTTRERLDVRVLHAQSNRSKRRAELRKARKVQAADMTHDPRAVKFHF